MRKWTYWNEFGGPNKLLTLIRSFGPQVCEAREYFKKVSATFWRVFIKTCWMKMMLWMLTRHFKVPAVAIRVWVSTRSIIQDVLLASLAMRITKNQRLIWSIVLERRDDALSRKYPLAGALLCVRAAELRHVGVDNKLSNWCSNVITISRNKVCV